MLSEGRAYDQLSDTGPLRVPPYCGAAEAKGFPEKELDELTRGYGGQIEVLVRERLDGLTMDYGISKNGTICHVRTFRSVVLPIGTIV